MKRITIVVALLIFSALISYGCIPFGDSGINVQGKVFERINAPTDTTSKIYIVSLVKYNDMIQELESLVENINKDMTIIPVKDASIKIGKEKDFQYSNCRSCVIKEISDENGDFCGTGDLPASKFKFQVRVTCPGYVDVIGELENGEYVNHAIVAILVRS